MRWSWGVLASLLLPSMLVADPGDFVLWSQHSTWICVAPHDCHMITYPMPVWDYRQARETLAECERVKPHDYDIVHDPEIAVLVERGKRTITLIRFVCLPAEIDPYSLNQEMPASGR